MVLLIDHFGTLIQSDQIVKGQQYLYEKLYKIIGNKCFDWYRISAGVKPTT
jgi:hypothetical protein